MGRLTIAGMLGASYALPCTGRASVGAMAASLEGLAQARQARCRQQRCSQHRLGRAVPALLVNHLLIDSGTSKQAAEKLTARVISRIRLQHCVHQPSVLYHRCSVFNCQTLCKMQLTGCSLAMGKAQVLEEPMGWQLW